MTDYIKNGLEFLKSTFMGGGLRFAIRTLPVSFRTNNREIKDRTRRDIEARMNRLCTKEACEERFFSGELKVELVCYFNRRYSTTDVDNIAKFILDCMSGLAFENDRQIKELIVKKIKGSKESREYIGVGISKF